MTTPIIVWFRRDLRLGDNPALHAAAAVAPVIPVYIDDPDDPWAAGGAARERLHDSLAALCARLERRGSRLVIRRGAAPEVLRELAVQVEAAGVYFNRRNEPWWRERDAACRRALAAHCEVRDFVADVLFEPALVRNRQGGPYRVFTPFYRAAQREFEVAAPLPVPRMTPPDDWPKGLALDSLGYRCTARWAHELRARWQGGESAAHAALDEFMTHIEVYPHQRDLPARAGTSNLSHHLAWGEISPREAWHAATAWSAAYGGRGDSGVEAWIRQLAWRDFAHHVLFHFPHTSEAPMNEAYAAFEWLSEPNAVERWSRGRTGFPIVDAGMRQLWRTGWMHNRVRMLVASLLTKHLGIHWLEGARWFWDTLIDADLANNSLGWQWVAGCGADAAPYYRIFNPVSQSRKFDPDGSYIRRWVSELRDVDTTRVHDPNGTVSAYPGPMVDLASARAAALERHARLREAGTR